MSDAQGIWFCPRCGSEPVDGYMTYISRRNTLLTWRCAAGHEWTLERVERGQHGE